MAAGYLLDTNIAIALLNGDAEIAHRLEALSTVRLSVTIVGELLYGAEKSQRTEANRKRLHPLVEQLVTICPDLETADYYAKIKN